MRFLILIVLLVSTSAFAQDGHLFDQGRTMTDRSERADQELDRMKVLLGQWDVSVITYPTDSTPHQAEGTAEIAYMNRGYAYMERRQILDYDTSGVEDHAMSFLTYAPSVQRWGLGEGRSYTEHIEMYDGPPEASDNLVLETAVRRGGGMSVTRMRVTYSLSSADTFEVRMEDDASGEWRTAETRRYSRRSPEANFMAIASDHGTATPGLPPEAREFDFLIGTWDAAHRLNLAGNWISFPQTATGVFALGGHGILEHSWFDLDPSLPDAATSILRIYNRAERRWESLYLANRGNTLLDFGGQREDDRIVLHGFDTRLTDTISRYVFHSTEPDTYEWFAESSTDRGQTFAQTWTIDFTRR